MFKLTPLHIIWLKLCIHMGSLSWLGWHYYLGFSDKFHGDPVKMLIHSTGLGALVLMLLSLAISPLAQQFRQANLIKARRLLGLYSFAYACCHILNYLAFDLQFDWPVLLEDIIKRPYISVGFAAFLIFFTLALTSPNAVKRALKQRWQKIHNWVYLAAILVVIHFFWSVKSDIYEPGFYALALFILLLLRKKQLKYWIKKQIKA